MTSGRDPTQRLNDLARLRRVRDRIDREYAQPLDVEALARDAHMSAGHFSREFRLENPGEVGKVNVTVLEFATKPAADAAYEKVRGWLDTCPASMAEEKLFTAGPIESIEIDTTPEIDRAAQTLAEYAGDCGSEGCDSTWYDRQTVAQIGTRLVLVTHAEGGGPCPPTRACPPEEASDYTEWDNRVAQTVKATMDRAVRGLS
jgi:hypothetical protein